MSIFAKGKSHCARLIWLAAPLLAIPLLATPAAAFDLAQPIACDLGQSCFIQNYPDRDPGPGWRDFTCGSLGYDGHDGTDFALPTMAAMEAGVDVLAAAPGVVRGVRDGMADISIKDPAAPPLEGRDCGNGLAITHDDGWETQYCHMKRGSLRLKAGDRVAAGEVLGQVGLSGRTEFPHLHVTVRQNGEWVDPFDPDDRDTCATPSADLWSPDLKYAAGGLVNLGIAGAVPEFEAIKAGLSTPDPLPARHPALVLWAHYFGSQPGDALVMSITGPDGVLIQDRVGLDRAQARGFRAIGRKLADRPGWTPGDWQAKVVMMRGTVEIGRQEIAFRVEG